MFYDFGVEDAYYIAPEGKINFFEYLIEEEDYRTNYDEDFDYEKAQKNQICIGYSL